ACTPYNSRDWFAHVSGQRSHALRCFSLEGLSIQTSLACNDHISIFDFRFESDCGRDNIEARPNFCAAKAHQAEAESACGASTWFVAIVKTKFFGYNVGKPSQRTFQNVQLVLTCAFL